MNTRESIVILYPRYLKKLAAKGIALEVGESLITYSKRVDDLMEEKIGFEEITEKFLIARYSNEEIEKEDVELVKYKYKQLIKILKKLKNQQNQ